MTYENLLLEKKSSIAYVTVNRPKVLNALNMATMEELRTAFTDIKPDPAKVDSFMAASGYAKDSSGIWAKGGKQLVIKWMVNTGNKRRENTQAEFIPLLAKRVTVTGMAGVGRAAAARARSRPIWSITI